VKKNTENFCQVLLNLGINNAKALANLVMALSSFKESKSVVGLSTSPVYHYQYSSICDAIDSLSSDDKSYGLVSTVLRQFCLNYYESFDNIYRLNSDTTPINKAHSLVLSERSFIHVSNNVISTNKPLGIGYRLSTLTLCGKLNWQLPLSMELVSNEQTATECLLSQLSLMFTDKQLPLNEAKLVTNRLDRAYGNAHYLAPSFQYPNLVNIVRFRSGQKIWLQNIRTQTGGRNSIYDDNPYYLINESRTKTFKNKDKFTDKYQRSIFDLPPDETSELCQITANGRKITLQINRWKNLLFRSKKGNRMSDKPFDLVAIKTIDALSGKCIFQENLFIGICGQKKDELSIEQTVIEYQERYGIEPFFRFSKQNLFLESFQTPDDQHLKNWFLVVQLAVWLLYQVAQEAPKVTPKWQQYLPKEKIQNPMILSLAQAYKAAQNLFITFDKNPFLPQKSQKGKPRQKGDKQVTRIPKPIVLKKKKPPV
jgi:hypothetical protein